MCNHHSYREAGYTPRKENQRPPDENTGKELWERSPHNPKNRKTSNGTEFQEDHVR